MAHISTDTPFDGERRAGLNPVSDYGGHEAMLAGREIINQVVRDSEDAAAAEAASRPATLFDAMDMEPETSTASPNTVDRYGHVEGASARVLRASDQAFLRAQNRRNRGF